MKRFALSDLRGALSGALTLLWLGHSAHAAQDLTIPVDKPAALRWDAAHHAGALAGDGRVWVIHEQADALQLLGALPAPGVTHLAAGLDDGSVYASASDEGTLKLIDLADATLRGSLAAGGPRPESLLYNPILKRLASFNAGVGTVTLFDMGSRSFEGLIPLGEAPVAVQMASDGRVLALLAARHELVLLGLRPLRIFARWPLPESCPSARDLALDSGQAQQQVFVACGTERLARFALQDGTWQPEWSGAVTGSGVVQLFWDGPRKRLLTVTDAGTVLFAASSSDAVRTALTRPAGSVFEWDATSARMLALTRTASGAHSLSFISLP